MATASYRVCPSCGTRNKLKWEACARCGELLGDVAVAAAPEAPRAARPPRAAAVAPSPVSPLALVAIAAAVVFFFQFHGQTPVVPSADSFTIPTQPPAPAARAELPPQPGYSSFTRGRLMLLRGNVAEAVSLLREAVAEAPGEALYREYYAKALWQAGSREQALREHDAAVQLNPRSVEYRSERALAYMASDRGDEAARDFARVLEVDPNHVEALRALAHLKGAQGDTTAALSLLQRAAGLRAGDPVIAQDLGYALEKAGNTTQARMYYADVVGRLPDAQIARSRLAETLFLENRAEDAIRVVQEGIDRAPTAPLLRRTLGSLLERSGRVPEAVAAYREYARLAPNAEDARTLEARAAGLERRQQAAATQEARVGP